MKGLICAGGLSTRLYPLSLVSSKALLPVYDRPMIYFALSCLMRCQIRDVAVIVPPVDRPKFENLLSDGSQWGMHIEFIVQEKATGIASCLTLAKPFLGEDAVAMILADNFFCGETFSVKLRNAIMNAEHGLATVFGKAVDDPRRFGVVSFDAAGKAVTLEEKPENPKSPYAVTGLYFYPAGAPDFVKELVPSARGELEITDLNAIYMRQGRLQVELLEKNFTWMDLGTMQSLLEGSNFVKALIDSGFKLDAPELVALRNGWIDTRDFEAFLARSAKSTYGTNLYESSGA